MTDPTEMELRVAQAMNAKALADGWDGYEWDDLPERARGQACSVARAAIQAMWEPTDAMKAAGFAASPHDVSGGRDQIDSDEAWMQEAVVEPWQAMIDAASPNVA